MNDLATVPFYVFEAMVARYERKLKRLAVALMVACSALFAVIVKEVEK